MNRKREPLARIDLLQGTLDLIILQTLRWGPGHGYGIARMIQATSKDALRVNTGSLYPALQRLEKKRLIRAKWVVSDNRQRVREYHITPAGRRHLEVQRTRWEQLSEAMALILAPRQEGEA